MDRLETLLKLHQFKGRISVDVIYKWLKSSISSNKHTCFNLTDCRLKLNQLARDYDTMDKKYKRIPVPITTTDIGIDIRDVLKADVFEKI